MSAITKNPKKTMINREDKADVKASFGKGLANKVAKATDDSAKHMVIRRSEKRNAGAKPIKEVSKETSDYMHRKAINHFKQADMDSKFSSVSKSKALHKKMGKREGDTVGDGYKRVIHPNGSMSRVKMHGKGEYSKVSFSPRNKQEERSFSKHFRGNTNSEGGIPFGRKPK